ncbi:MAG: alkyl hydroperoxide reductase [Gaiellales bacterium]
MAALERELDGQPFLAIGVHSPKFPNERDPDRVRDAVRRYAVTHPVVVDSGMEIWQQFGVRAWPTLAVVDPTGRLAAAGSGEPDRDRLLEVVRDLIEDGRRLGTIDPRPLPLQREPWPAGILAYPGKAVAGDTRVVVADTGHDQVVVIDGDGEPMRLGAPDGGFADGAAETARFHHPNGLALDGDTLWVADTGNHAIRRIDLAAGVVETVAGTGEKGMGATAGSGMQTALRSPWDLALDGSRLYIAMAGAHQIWLLDSETGLIEPFAGAGPEMVRDGPAAEAAFAQPSGICMAPDGCLYVADSEASTIRRLDDLSGSPRVSTVCGSGDLFGFGLRDGIGGDALLQHPIGIAAGADGMLYVADTYNHAIRRVDPATGECVTLFGNGEPETLAELFPGQPLAPAGPDAPCLFEPEGVWVREGEVLVADTNNHRLLSIDLTTGERRHAI